MPSSDVFPTVSGQPAVQSSSSSLSVSSLDTTTPAAPGPSTEPLFLPEPSPPCETAGAQARRKSNAIVVTSTIADRRRQSPIAWKCLVLGRLLTLALVLVLVLVLAYVPLHV